MSIFSFCLKCNLLKLIDSILKNIKFYLSIKNVKEQFHSIGNISPTRK